MQGIPTIIDIEASGFGADSYPIEIGIAQADEQTACYLICPHDDWQHWDMTGERLHRLSRETIMKFGKPVEVVANSLNQLLAARTVYSDAWGFDQSWLGKLYEKAGVRQQFRLESLQSLFDEAQYSVWNRTLDQVFLESEFTRHRASNDARAIQLAYMRSNRLAQVS